jgi:glycosyltransferase involved in cell wall biosynthesis
MLVVLTTHPIQYQVPLWQRLAERGRIEFEVWYLSDHGLGPSLDRDFGRTFAWDLDLTSGYPHRFLERGGSAVTGFWGSTVRNFDGQLRAAGATALLVNGWQSAAYWRAVWEGRRMGVPVWLRGESNDLRHAPLWKRGVKRLALGTLFGAVDHFLAIGTANRRLYRRYGVPETRIHLAPYAVDNDRFARQAELLAADRASLRASFGIAPDAFCLLFAGKLIEKKRPRDLVAAVRLLQAGGGVSAGLSLPRRPLHLLFTGDGILSDALRAECDVVHDVRAIGGDTPATRPTERPRASFTGFLNQTEISRAYVAADCLVLPSDARETWGLVVNEAMASGLPAIVSDACGCAEDLVVPLDRRLTFRMGSREDLARAITDAEQGAPAAEALRAFIRDFSFDRMAGVIETLAGHPRAAGTRSRDAQAGAPA